MGAPRCLACFRQMKLARVERGASNDTEVRKYQCERCDRTKCIVAPKDPLTSDAARWLSGELRPPD